MIRNRPILAAAICIYEGLAGLCILVSYAFSQFFVNAFAPGAHHFKQSPLSVTLILLAALLSFGIAITLWMLRREAFFLSLLKLLIMFFSAASLLYVLFSGRMHVNVSTFNTPTGLLFFWLPRMIDAIFLLIAIAITVYIFRLTFFTPPPSEPYIQPPPDIL